MADTENRTPRFQFRLLAEVILFKIYETVLDDNAATSVSAFDLQRMFSVPVPRKLIESALTHLRGFNPQLVVRSGKQGNYKYRISEEGMLFVESALKRPSSLIHYYSVQGDEHIDDAVGFQAVFHISDEETGLDWIPLVFNENSPEYGAALGALRQSIEEIRGSNDFSERFPEEKDSILESLHEGKSKLEKGKITRHALFSYIINPLRWVTSVFAKGALSAVAATAAQKMIQLLSTIL